MMKHCSTSARLSTAARASSRDVHPSTSAGKLKAAGSRERTTFTRPGSGRNLSGIDSHVLRPMITAFSRSPTPAEAVSVVIRLKYAMSPGRRQGSWPSFPIPPSFVHATISERGLNAVDGGEAVDSCGMMAVAVTQKMTVASCISTERAGAIAWDRPVALYLSDETPRAFNGFWRSGGGPSGKNRPWFWRELGRMLFMFLCAVTNSDALR